MADIDGWIVNWIVVSRFYATGRAETEVIKYNGQALEFTSDRDCHLYFDTFMFKTHAEWFAKGVLEA